MLQHRFLSSTSSSLKRYHFSTSSLLCKVGTIFDIPTSLFSTNTTKKLETLVQQYFYYCGCGGGKGKCQYAIFYPFAREKLTCELSLQCDTILYNYFSTTSNIPFQAVNFIIPSFFTLGNEKFMLSLSYNSYYLTVYHLAKASICVNFLYNLSLKLKEAKKL